VSVLPVGFSSGGVSISNSLRFRANASAYLNRTYTTPTTQNVYTWSGWCKRGKLTALQNLFGVSTNHSLGFSAGDALVLTIAGAASITSTPLYRDTSAWYHVLYSQNGTSASLQVNNGTAMTATVTSSVFNTAVSHQIGASNTSNYFDGYLSDVYFIDGQALTPSSFGETNPDGVWIPKGYTGTYGTNGFHLDFRDAALTSVSNVGLGKDVSGNSNYWVTNTISVTAGSNYDSMVDTPTNNYATMNPLAFPFVSGTAPTLQSGNLNLFSGASLGASGGFLTTIIPTGKTYWEGFVNRNNDTVGIGVIKPQTGSSVSNPHVYFQGTKTGGSKIWKDGSAVQTGLTNIAANDVIAAEFDPVAATIAFYLNGTQIGTTVSSIGAEATNPFAYAVTDAAGNGSDLFLNFGQAPLTSGATYSAAAGGYFKYTPSTGFKALCTANLSAVTIPKPAKYFDAKTRTGTVAAFNVTGIGFSPNLVWTKGRSGATDHALYDTDRGVQKDIGSNLATDQTTQAQGVTAFNSDGFSGGTLAKINTNTSTYIDWMWDESVTSGLDIVSVTGNGTNRTVSHNLGVVPKMIIGKSLTTAGADTGWPVYHASLANTEYLILNTTAGKATGATYWNSTTPTASVFSLGTAADVNTNADTYIYYVFAEVAGFSKFGSYVGNNSTDGPFVHCGFRPKFIMTKRSDSTSDWVIVDAARNTYNLAGARVYPDVANAEDSADTTMDITANGFKLRTTSTTTNASSGTYIFAAFAEFPFGGINVSPSPAR
jgi:hypothetical protein